ncbi:MAG TPA: hypothetical protein VFU41_12165, partial [Gemmatimonadales bacterium]|nr:hypothetical protein [Gemmatimonadales bacterium]
GAGGGRTLPLATFARSGTWFAGLSLALQEVDPSRTPESPFIGVAQLPVARDPINQPLAPTVAPAAPNGGSHGNAYAFVTVGKVLSTPRLSLAGSVLWSKLNAVDGVDLLYAGSQGIRQSGHAADVRLGLLKEWDGDRSFEAVVVHNRFGMTHDVTYLDLFWSPDSQRVLQRPRGEHNVDRTNTWGLHLEHERPLAASGWRIGWLATANRMSHPKIPSYEIVSVPAIPRDPGHSQAYNLGVGVARANGPATFGLDAIYEPIWSHTWAEAEAPVATQRGDTIPAGGMTIENHFRFSNALFRMGVSRDLQVGGRPRGAGLQLGLAVRSVRYGLVQRDHVQGSRRQQREWWVEWTPTWGLSLRFPELELRYAGRVTKGTGRPGVQGNGFLLAEAGAVRGGNILMAPGGPLTLDPVSVVTHQVSLSLPLH